MKIPLADVPPAPDWPVPTTAPNGDRVYEQERQRWRFDAAGVLKYFIRYAADGRTHEAFYAAPGRR